MSGAPVCSEHGEDEVRFHCKECSRSICDECVISNCKDHHKVRLKTFIEEKRKDCEDLIKDVKERKITEIEKRLATLTASSDAYYCSIEQEILSVKNRTEALKQILDDINNDLVSQLITAKETMKTEIANVLESDRSELANLQEIVRKFEEDGKLDDKVILKEGTLLNKSEIKPEPLPDFKHPKYVFESRNDKNSLEILCGHIDEGHYEDITINSEDGTPSEDVIGSTFVQGRNKTEIKQSDEPFSPGEEIIAMACNEEGIKWVLGKSTMWEVKNQVSNPQLEERMKTRDISTERMAISRKGYLFISKISKKCIKLYKPPSSNFLKQKKREAEKAVFLMTGSLSPLCVGIVSRDEIVVCLGQKSPEKDMQDLLKLQWHQIEPKYGKLLKEVELKTPVYNPVSVTRNSIGELLIINHEQNKNSSIICLKTDGSLKFQYPKASLFECHFLGVACLSDGTSVILDQLEPSLHLIDLDGILLQKDPRPRDKIPTCITNDMNDRIWIGYSSGVIQSITYKHSRVYEELY